MPEKKPVLKPVEEMRKLALEKQQERDKKIHEELQAQREREAAETEAKYFGFVEGIMNQIEEQANQGNRKLEFHFDRNDYTPAILEMARKAVKEAGYNFVGSWTNTVDHGDSAAPAQVTYTVWDITW